MTIAKNERLNEEAARNNNTPPLASTEVIERVNELNDREKQLPKTSHQNSNDKVEKGYIASTNRRSDDNDEAYPRYS